MGTTRFKVKHDRFDEYQEELFQKFYVEAIGLGIEIDEREIGLPCPRNPDGTVRVP